VSKLDQEPDSLEMSLLKEGITRLSPGERSTATQNSQYLQSNTTNGAAILAAGRSSHRLEASISEVEETVLLLLQDDVPLTHSVRTKMASLRASPKSFTVGYGGSVVLGRTQVETGIGVQRRLSEEDAALDRFSYCRAAGRSTEAEQADKWGAGGK
jgi:hypothetical protein